MTKYLYSSKYSSTIVSPYFSLVLIFINKNCPSSIEQVIIIECFTPAVSHVLAFTSFLLSRQISAMAACLAVWLFVIYLQYFIHWSPEANAGWYNYDDKCFSVRSVSRTNTLSLESPYRHCLCVHSYRRSVCLSVCRCKLLLSVCSSALQLMKIGQIFVQKNYFQLYIHFSVIASASFPLR